MTLLIGVSPGPGVLNMLGLCLGRGRGFVIAAVAGAAAGNFIAAALATVAAAGLVSRFAPPPAMLALAGGAYLIGLGGWLALTPASRRGPEAPARGPVLQSLASAALNPKSYAFLAATLPPLAARGGGLADLWWVPPVYVAVLALTSAGYGCLATLVRPAALMRARRTVSILCGVGLALAGLAVLLNAFAE